LSRNWKTGKSRHYAFIEFSDPKVAKIVAENMNGHIILNRILQCKYIEPERVHPKLFEGPKTGFVPVIYQRMKFRKIRRHNRLRTVKEHKTLTQKLLKKEEKKKSTLASMGISYQYHDYASCIPPKPKHVFYKE